MLTHHDNETLCDMCGDNTSYYNAEDGIKCSTCYELEQCENCGEYVRPEELKSNNNWHNACSQCEPQIYATSREMKQYEEDNA